MPHRWCFNLTIFVVILFHPCLVLVDAFSCPSVACNDPGYFLDSSCNFCWVCGAGSYAPTKSLTSCLSCSAGTYAPNNAATSCQSCAVNTYTSTSGSVSCTSCPVNTYTSSTGSTSCIACPAGTGSQPGYNCITSQPGSYISGSSSTLCSLGSYTNTISVTSCTQCSAGTYTPSTGATSCTSCPAGTYSPVAGYSSSTCTPCASGTFTNNQGSVSCTNCAGGYVSSNQGSSLCSQCSAGKFSNQGNTQCVSCPAGTYGSSTSLNANPSCSGLCVQGYYCPIGSISPTQYNCGNVTMYCPAGSGYPIVVSPGYYTVDVDGNSAPEMSFESYPHQVNQVPCPLGHFCLGGVKYQCPGGTFGSIQGLSSASCSGNCSAGYYCPPGSNSSTANDCGSANVYCPERAAFPIPVSTGYYTINDRNNNNINNLTYFNNNQTASNNTYHYSDSTHQVDQRICPPGSYCMEGIQYSCPAGFYGSSFGLNSSTCSGICAAGFYCPVNSTSSKAFDCGNRTRFCPAGSSEPQIVSPGYYSIGISLNPSYPFSNQFAQAPCEAGFYCVNGTKYLCTEGYYCPEFTVTTSLSSLRDCGNSSYYCPAGSSWPLRVSDGFYTLDKDNNYEYFNDTIVNSANINYYFRHQTHQNICPQGFYCIDGIKYKCTLGLNTTLYGQNTSDCAGKCLAGYFCDSSISIYPQDCGNSTVYCPSASSVPILVSKGFFTINNQGHFGHRSNSLEEIEAFKNQVAQEICPPWTYCENGLQIPCLPGKNGSMLYGAFSPQCNGNCSAGYVCTTGQAQNCGNSSVFCPPGSSRPIPVSEGYFTIDDQGTYGWSEEDINILVHQVQQIVCPIGHFCQNGLLIPCPDGTYGATQGLSSNSCTGYCFQGYVCTRGSTDGYGNHSTIYGGGGGNDDTKNSFKSTLQAEIFSPVGGFVFIIIVAWIIIQRKKRQKLKQMQTTTNNNNHNNSNNGGKIEMTIANTNSNPAATTLSIPVPNTFSSELGVLNTILKDSTATAATSITTATSSTSSTTTTPNVTQPLSLKPQQHNRRAVPFS